MQGGTCARCGRRGSRAAARGVLATSRNAQVREAGAGTAIANCVDLHSGITDMHLTEFASPELAPRRPPPTATPGGSRTSAAHRAAPTAGRAAASVLRAPSHRHGSIAASSTVRGRAGVLPRLHSDACAAVRWFAACGCGLGRSSVASAGTGLGRSHVPRPVLSSEADRTPGEARRRSRPRGGPGAGLTATTALDYGTVTVGSDRHNEEAAGARLRIAECGMALPIRDRERHLYHLVLDMRHT